MQAVQNLIQLAGGMPDDCVERSYIECYASSSDIMQIMPFVDHPSDIYQAEYEACLPEFEIWRAWNEKPDGDWGSTDTFIEQSYQNGFNLPEVEARLLRDPAEREKRFRQWEMHMKAFGRAVTDSIIFGNELSGKKCPIGLKARLPKTPQHIYAPLDMSQGHIANNFDPVSGQYVAGGLPLKQEVYKRATNMVNSDNGQLFWIMNSQMKTQIESQANDYDLGYQRGESICEGLKCSGMLYGIPILTGYNNFDQFNFLPFTETPEGGNINMMPETTSIYLVAFGRNGFRGFRHSMRPPEAVTKGLQADDCMLWENMGYRDGFGLILPKHSAVRISGIRFGKITKE